MNLPVPIAANVQADIGDGASVPAHLAGDFPGSPLGLRCFFSISGDKIASLEIRP